MSELAHSQIVFSQTPQEFLSDFLSRNKYSKIFVLTDRNVFDYVYMQFSFLHNFPVIILDPGEANKNFDSVLKIWEFLLKNNASRDALLINLGGGVITDLGGFAAATFKRGINFINIPTTLLAQVDAAVGGKTGFNLHGIKNAIGVFVQPVLTVVNVLFLKTLQKRQFISGFAEMVKHALLDGESSWKKIKSFDIHNIDYDFLELLVKHSVRFKQKVVEEDFRDSGKRKILNFGHTIGHAIESYFLEKGVDILHGEAVAIGIMAEIYLSNKRFIFNVEKVLEISSFMSKIFPAYHIPYSDYEQIWQIMQQDKKNRSRRVLCTLLEDFGKPHIDMQCDKSDLIEALNFYHQFSN